MTKTGHSLQLTLENVFEVHYTATKYDIRSLISQCCSFIKTHLEVDTVLTILSIAIAWNEPEIVESCLELVELNAPAVFKQTAFLKLHKTEVISILKRELLINEIDIFLRVEDWLRHNINNEARTNDSITAENIQWILSGENKNDFVVESVSANMDSTQERNPGFYGEHTVSKEILQYVRFGLMTAEELVKYVKHSLFVSKDTYIMALEQAVVPQLVGYKSKPRIPPVSFAIGGWIQTYPGWRLVSNIQEFLDNFGAFVETFSSHCGLPLLSEFEIVAWGIRLADGTPLKYLDAELSVATAKKEFKTSGKLTGSVVKISDGLTAWKTVNNDMKGNFGGKPKVVGAKDRPGLFISLKRRLRLSLSADPRNDSIMTSPKQ